MVGGHGGVVEGVEEELWGDARVVEEVVGELHLCHVGGVLDTAMAIDHSIDWTLGEVGFRGSGRG